MTSSRNETKTETQADGSRAAGPGRPAFPQVMAVAVGFETSYRRIWRTNIAPDLVICPSMDPHRSCNYGHECGQIVGTPAGPGPRSRRPGGPDAHQVRHSGPAAKVGYHYSNPRAPTG